MLVLKEDPPRVCAPQTCLLLLPGIDLALCNDLVDERDIGMKKMSSMLSAAYKGFPIVNK